MSDERREHPRIPVSLAGEIDSGGERTSIAITRDLSSTGVLILSRREHAVGASLSIRVRFKDNEVILIGKVVRREEIDPNISSLWRYKVALVIDPSPAFDQLMTELSAPAAE